MDEIEKEREQKTPPERRQKKIQGAEGNLFPHPPHTTLEPTAIAAFMPEHILSWADHTFEAASRRLLVTSVLETMTRGIRPTNHRPEI